MNLLLISRDFCYTDTCLIKSPGRIEVSAWRGNVQGEIMLGIIYLLLAGMLGCEASKMLTGEGVCQVLIVSGSCFRLLLESEHFY